MCFACGRSLGAPRSNAYRSSAVTSSSPFFSSLRVVINGVNNACTYIFFSSRSSSIAIVAMYLPFLKPAFWRLRKAVLVTFSRASLHFCQWFSNKHPVRFSSLKLANTLSAWNSILSIATVPFSPLLFINSHRIAVYAHGVSMRRKNAAGVVCVSSSSIQSTTAISPSYVIIIVGGCV